MPIFEYRCEDCGGEFEDLVPHAERDEPQECPCCGGKKSKRLMSRFATTAGSSYSCSRSGPRPT